MWQNNSCAPLEICSSAFGLVVWAAAVGFITSIKVSRSQLGYKFVSTSVLASTYKTPYFLYLDDSYSFRNKSFAICRTQLPFK